MQDKTKEEKIQYYEYICYVFYKARNVVFYDLYTNFKPTDSRLEHLQRSSRGIWLSYTASDHQQKDSLKLYSKKRVRRQKNDYNEERMFDKTFRVPKNKTEFIDPLNLLINHENYEIDQCTKERIKSHQTSKFRKAHYFNISTSSMLDEEVINDFNCHDVEEVDVELVVTLPVANERKAKQSTEDCKTIVNKMDKSKLDVGGYRPVFDPGKYHHVNDFKRSSEFASESEEIEHNIKMLESLNFLQPGKYTVIGKVAFLHHYIGHAWGDHLVDWHGHTYGTRIGFSEMMEYLMENNLVDELAQKINEKCDNE